MKSKRNNETMKWCVKFLHLENWHSNTHVYNKNASIFHLTNFCESADVQKTILWQMTNYTASTVLKTEMKLKCFCLCFAAPLLNLKTMRSLAFVFESKIRHFLMLFHWPTFCTNLLMRAMLIDKLICVI